MLIQTEGDARAALDQLDSDIVSTATDVANAYAATQNSWGNPVYAGVGLTTQLGGGNDVVQAASSLLNQLAGTALGVRGQLIGVDSDALTPDLVARMRELQSEVISDRKLVGQAISSVDWTFGEFVADVANQTANLASQAVAAVSNGLGINWTYVELGAAALGLLLVYALFLRVRG